MFGPVLYEAFRTIKRAFDPEGILHPGKIVDPPPITSTLRFGAGYQTPNLQTWFDYSDYGGMGGAVEMCSGLGACRKKLDGTMCPSYMATLEEAHSTRGRANTLRLAMAGRLGESGLGDEGVHSVLDLCLECRACKAECPVGVDVARFKSEFLADYQSRHGTPMGVRLLAGAHQLAKWGSRFATPANVVASSQAMRALNEKLFGIDRRRTLPRWSSTTLTKYADRFEAGTADVLLFSDTFTNYYNPEIGLAIIDVFRAAGLRTGLAGNVCCGRPLISKGLLGRARELASQNTGRLFEAAERGRKIVFAEPSCLSAVREDAPSLLRGEEQRRARVVAAACVSFEEFLESELHGGRQLLLKRGPAQILLHGHCHQKSMGLLPVSKALLARIPGASIIDPDAGCCGMAGSFGYEAKHFEVSRAIGERRLFPAVRNVAHDASVVAPGFSCRHQIRDFTGVDALHPALLLQSLLPEHA
jgi:Fe-S oxidoreductase